MTLSFLESYVRVFWNSWILYLSNLSNSIWIFVKVVATPCPCKMHCRRGWSLTWKYVYLPESTNVWLMRHCRAVVGKQQTRTLQLGDEALPSAVLEALSLDVLQFKFASFRFHLECGSWTLQKPCSSYTRFGALCQSSWLHEVRSTFSSVFYTWPPCGGLIRAQDAKTAALGLLSVQHFHWSPGLWCARDWWTLIWNSTKPDPNYSKLFQNPGLVKLLQGKWLLGGLGFSFSGAGAPKEMDQLPHTVRWNPWWALTCTLMAFSSAWSAEMLFAQKAVSFSEVQWGQQMDCPFGFSGQEVLCLVLFGWKKDD